MSEQYSYNFTGSFKSFKEVFIPDSINFNSQTVLCLSTLLYICNFNFKLCQTSETLFQMDDILYFVLMLATGTDLEYSRGCDDYFGFPDLSLSEDFLMCSCISSSSFGVLVVVVVVVVVVVSVLPSTTLQQANYGFCGFLQFILVNIWLILNMPISSLLSFHNH